MHGFDDPGLDELLQQLDGLIPRDVAVEVRIFLEVPVQPVDGLRPGEAVLVDSHVPAAKERLKLQAKKLLIRNLKLPTK